MGNGNPLIFLIDTLFSLYIGALLLRFLLQIARADFYNPISQFLVKITNPPLVPLRRIIPSIRSIDTASLVLILGLIISKVVLISLLNSAPLQPIALILFAIVEFISLVLNLFFYSIILQAVLSWIQPSAYSPVQGILHGLNEPLLRPVRKVIPAIGGFDLSPIVVLLAIGVLQRFLYLF